MTFAGRFFGVCFAGAGKAAAIGAVAGVAAAASVADVDAALDAPATAGFDDCFEHALIASNSPRIAKPAIVAIASFCWRDQDDNVVTEIALLLGAGFVDFWLADIWLADFEMVAILSPPLRLAQSEVIGQESGQRGDH